MDNQHILKQGEESISSKKQNLKRKDPRENGENGSENSSDAENYSKKDAITDLDIAYSILYDEMKKEYNRERERVKERREGDKAAIPQRVFQSFLLSMENDINEYSDNVIYHKHLIKEERKLKSTIESDRKHLIKDKKDNGIEKSKIIVLKEQHAKLKRKVTTLKKAKELIKRARELFQSQQITFSIPTIPITQQINSCDLLNGINESIEAKIKIIEERNMNQN